MTALCHALPGAEHVVQGDHTVYRVRGKVFADFLDDHHGDGIVSVCVKSERGENLDRARLEPERSIYPRYPAARLVRHAARPGPRRWREVAEIVERSYRLTAPKTLLKQLDGA